MMGGLRNGLFAGLARNRITLKISSLSAILLGALVLSTAVMVLDLWHNQQRVAESTERFRFLEYAAEADRDFGEMRYWLTDLSVSLLTLSERRAQAARDNLETHLDKVASFAPEAAEQIRQGVETYVNAALKAADAYTEERRVIGNTLSAEARLGSDMVDGALKKLVNDLATEAATSEEAAQIAARNSVVRAFAACIFILIAGSILTWRVLRSILTPLSGINRAISELNAGAQEVELPPEGVDELGRMSSAVRALQESQNYRRQLEAEAKNQRMTILTAIETIPDGFALFDENDNLVLTNERYRSMFSNIAHLLKSGTAYRDILMAQAAADPEIVGDETLDQWMQDRLRNHQKPNIRRNEVRISGAWVQVTKSKTPSGGTVAVYSDISGLIEKQAELEVAREGADTANEAKSRFLASMSHELRTPLNAIIGYSEMLIDDAQDAEDDTNIADLERIKSSGQHLLALINDILDLSKIEAGKMEIYTERFAIAPLIEDVAATIRPIIDKNANTLTTQINASIIEIETDKTKLRQNLFNLLSNAAKFTTGGKIELIVDETANTIDFTIRDDGIGMTADQKGRLFEAFMQADSSTTRNYGGTGLGLAIVKQFTEMVGGSVDVMSEPGKGSAFKLSFPKQMSIDDSDMATRQSVKANGRILVIDDDQKARQAMTDLLDAEGYISIMARDAHSGLKLAAEHRPDAIILDIIMPGQDGWFVLNALKKDPELCEIPVILATVLGDRDMGLAFGAVDHLTKPINAQRLVDTLSAYAGSSNREALVVDDDPASRALFRRILVREGWTVREASDGVRALAQLEVKLPTIMVLDLMMPNLDGFETLRAVRESEKFQALPVIIATSKDLTRDEMDWLQSNARDVVIKGQTGRSDLMAAIRRTLSSADEKGRLQQ